MSIFTLGKDLLLNVVKLNYMLFFEGKVNGKTILLKWLFQGRKCSEN